MTDRPDVLLLHQAALERDRIRAAFDDQFGPDLDLRVAETPADSREALSDARIAISFALTDEQLAAADDLEWVHALNAGVDGYPVEALGERGIALTNSSGIHGEQMGQQVLGYMLYFERRFYEGLRQQRAGEYERYTAGELGDDTLGIVGLGAIGSRIGEYGKRLGMTVVGTKRDPASAPDCADACYGADELDAVLERADYLVVSCPLTDATEGLIDADAFERLDESAVLINIARGPIVDQDALTAALEDGEIRGAALDVSDPEPMPADSPLRSMHNVVMTPHMAGASPYYFDRAIELFAENYRARARGETLRNRIV